ncbi:MAG: hypothetical protein ACRD8W_05585 [Nitrososphaeraceae archaeon]
MVLKFEILLPLYYNDGREIEDEKFQTTYDEIISKFDAITVGSTPLLGDWRDPVTRVRYSNERFRACWVICEDTASNLDYFQTKKTDLESRFTQQSILIYYLRVDFI